VDRISYSCQHINTAKEKNEPTSKQLYVPCLPPFPKLHVAWDQVVYEFCGACSNTHIHPSALSVNGFVADLSFEHGLAPAYLHQNTIRKNIRNKPDGWSFSARFVSRWLLFALAERRLCRISA
jgi:hypothetical protein